MDRTYLVLDYWQVGLAALLILVNGAISLALKLELERPLLIASARTVVQLLLVGLVLQWVFAVRRWYLVLVLLLVMTGQLLAGVEPVQAVKYQIVIMFLIASGTALGTVGVVLLSYRRLFNAAHQFVYWRIKEPP
jgi:ABC-type iron transport system FetAB permease component